MVMASTASACYSGSAGRNKGFRLAPDRIQTWQWRLIRRCMRAVDPPKPIDDAREYEKAELEARYREQVAELAFGEDAEALGGLTLDRNFARSKLPL